LKPLGTRSPLAAAGATAHSPAGPQLGATVIAASLNTVGTRHNSDTGQDGGARERTVRPRRGTRPQRRRAFAGSGRQPSYASEASGASRANASRCALLTRRSGPHTAPKRNRAPSKASRTGPATSRNATGRAPAMQACSLALMLCINHALRLQGLGSRPGPLCSPIANRRTRPELPEPSQCGSRPPTGRVPKLRTVWKV
jgi:hypothetical protein